MSDDSRHNRLIDQLRTEFRPGDLFACWGTDRVSRVISFATSTPFAPRGLRFAPAHIAICSESEWLPGSGPPPPVWVESTTLSDRPCLVHRRPVSGCQVHRPTARITEYLLRGGRVDLYRLAPIWGLTPDESGWLGRTLFDRFVRPGVGYDLGGALVSGTRVLKFSRLLRAGLDSLFCSELVAAVLSRLGRLPVVNPTRWNPASLLRTLVRSGVYRRETVFRAPSPPLRIVG